jgi:hypothetical protein
MPDAPGVIHQRPDAVIISVAMFRAAAANEIELSKLGDVDQIGHQVREAGSDERIAALTSCRLEIVGQRQQS